MSTSSRGPRAAAYLIVLVLAGAGCAPGSMAGDVADAVQGSPEIRGYDVEEVSCADGLAADDDSTTCQVTVGGEEHPLEVRSQGSGNGRGIDIDFDASDIPKG